MSPAASPAPNLPPRRHLFVFWLILPVVLALYFISARWHVLHGAINTDEGFYAITTRSVAQGEMPYRDFGFTQPPLVLYANALPLRFLGFGLFPQRIVNGLWAALAVGLAASWLARRTHVAWGLGLVLLFALTAPWMYFIHLGKTYGVTTLVAMLAAWAFLALPAGPRRNFLVGFLAVLGVASRLPAAPFFGLLGLFALWPGRRPTARELLAAAGGVALGLALAVAPFALAAPEALRFWTVDFHRLSVPNKPWTLTWRNLAALAPAAWLLAAVALGGATWHRRLLTRETAVLLAAGVALAGNLLPGGVYEEYATPFLLPFVTAAAALAGTVFQSRKIVLPILAAALLGAQLFIPPLLLNSLTPDRRGTLSQWLPQHTPNYNPHLATAVATARDLVKASLPADAPFIGTNIILAAETGHAVPAELRMGSFSWTGEMSAAQAARLHLATRDQLDAWFDQPNVTVLGFYQRWDLNYGWSMPSFQPEPPAVRERTLNHLERHFRLAYNDGDFFILVRRPPRPFSFPPFGSH